MQLIFEQMFDFSIWVAIVFLLWMPITWLLMRFITPKSLVERYFKQPHFTSAELVLFSHFPGTLMRTGIFMNLCLWPSKGKKRKMTDVISHVPKWYVVAAKLFIYLFLMHGLVFILLSTVSISYILFINR